MYIRHELDQAAVSKQIEDKIDALERDRVRLYRNAVQAKADYDFAVANNKAHRWARPPSDPSWVDCHIDAKVSKARDWYSKVRVIEHSANRFFLVYGNTAETSATPGTGPFRSLAAAAAWFFGGGR